ncbi:MAG: ribonuclease E inhibitor RraB [Gemmatimonadota bacterium]|nr:ribonuclease E inhibitor RraB [Gemmatimonadota bacterium]MDH4349470.1 ribonuclease E inhibitor RraB [Gemmatimonadota bacterium]MDH5284668.1 ribonuclease E inhibitor RraB [Gemmatimonadota bacterium]
MSVSFLALLGLVGLVLYLRGRAGERAASDPDAVTLAELAAAGSDLYRDHEMEFFVYLPERRGAEEVARTLEHRGFSVQVGRPEPEGDWLCTARRLMRPELGELQRLRREFSALADTHAGAYDGWGTTVVEETGSSTE